MVGPGEVDEELEPEVKEECNTKYGDVTKVVIFEIANTTPEESVRIFIEFKRVESAIKGIFKPPCRANSVVCSDLSNHLLKSYSLRLNLVNNVLLL